MYSYEIVVSKSNNDADGNPQGDLRLRRTGVSDDIDGLENEMNTGMYSLIDEMYEKWVVSEEEDADDL